MYEPDRHQYPMVVNIGLRKYKTPTSSFQRMSVAQVTSLSATLIVPSDQQAATNTLECYYNWILGSQVVAKVTLKFEVWFKQDSVNPPLKSASLTVVVKLLRGLLHTSICRLFISPYLL